MSLDELLFYLLVYSFFGWMLENAASYLTEGKWKEPFLKGPYKPMYGIAPVLLLLLGRGQNPYVVLLLCFLIPTAVEYVSGYLLHKAFHHRWWNYSRFRLQLGGHICLRFSVYWTVLSLAFLRYIHPSIAGMYTVIAPVWAKVGAVFVLLFFIDFVWTCLYRRSAVKSGLIGQ